MILVNPILMSFLKNKISPNGEILHNSRPHSHNDFLGNKGDTLCREPQTRLVHRNHFAFATKKAKQKADH